MSSSHLDAVEIRPRGVHRSTIIWLHGLGADGHDFEPIVKELGLPDDLNRIHNEMWSFQAGI